LQVKEVAALAGVAVISPPPAARLRSRGIDPDHLSPTMKNRMRRISTLITGLVNSTRRDAKVFV
jgi:hypothetical protein